MDKKDIRWQQRFQNFESALRYLQEINREKEYTEIEIDATIQRFEIAFELAWKTLQDYLEEQGYFEYKGPKKVLMKSFQDSLIKDGEAWIQMHEDRNVLSHAYDYDRSREIFYNIINTYIPMLESFYKKMCDERDK